LLTFCPICLIILFEERRHFKVNCRLIPLYPEILQAGSWWLTPVILATEEAETRRITVGSQPGQILLETLSQKTFHKNRTGGKAQGEGLEFKP
jgi:hypothetical protein